MERRFVWIVLLTDSSSLGTAVVIGIRVANPCLQGMEQCPFLKNCDELLVLWGISGWDSEHFERILYLGTGHLRFCLSLCLRFPRWVSSWGTKRWQACRNHVKSSPLAHSYELNTSRWNGVILSQVFLPREAALSYVFELLARINQMAYSCRLHELPVCILVGILGVIIDTPAIGIVAFCKVPIMLIKGWHRLLEDLVTRHGPCLEAACVPFAGLALVFWPFVVLSAAFTAFLCSPFLGLYSAVVVYQVCFQCLHLFLL